MPTPSARRIPLALAVAGAVAVGSLTALQARVNGQLGLRLQDGMLAAVISFGSGLVAVLALCALTRAGRRGVAKLGRGVRERRIPWWMLAGGAAGALTVATQGLAVGVIGVSLFTVGVVAGQTLNGLMLDRIGYSPAGVMAITLPRLAGGALVLAAMVISLLGGAVQRVPLWMLVLPLLAGVGIAWQQATNGRLGARVGSSLVATAVNFAGGTVLLTIGAVISLAITGPAAPMPDEPWLYTGGVIGVTYILLSVALVGRIGVLVLGVGAVAGQLVTAFVLDLWWPADGAGSWQIQLLMVAVALSAVVVASAPGWWPRRRAAGD